MECKSDGALYELTNMIGNESLLNFNLESFADPNDDWGVLSKNGIFNKTHGEWGGVMGRVSSHTRVLTYQLNN